MMALLSLVEKNTGVRVKMKDIFSHALVMHRGARQLDFVMKQACTTVE
jgi:hypothetical protein